MTGCRWRAWQALCPVALPLVVVLLAGLFPERRVRPVAATPAPMVWQPAGDATFTSTREVDFLQAQPGGDLLAFTEGGALRFAGGAWHRLPEPPPSPSRELTWKGRRVRPTLSGLEIGGSGSLERVRMPASSGTHISALLVQGDSLWAALFGDGLWSWNGREWARVPLTLPPSAREITALARPENSETLWLGTRRQGIWSYAGGQWMQHLLPDEPFAHNVQGLVGYRGEVWASTLEDGLVVCGPGGWRHIGSGTLSSNAPRQMVTLGGRLYVRHSNEVVDSFDGKSWVRNCFPNLPRKQIISIAADEERLYLGQWGGWTEWDGKNFTHHLRIPELQIVPLLHLLPESENGMLWLGTQNRGLFGFDRRSWKVLAQDERHGLPDDWITCLGRQNRELLAGTFAGGLAWQKPGAGRWQSAPALQNRSITALAPVGASTLVGTRYGLYVRETTGELQPWHRPLPPRFQEIQALLPTRDGVWIGARNGLLFRGMGGASPVMGFAGEK